MRFCLSGFSPFLIFTAVVFCPVAADEFTAQDFDRDIAPLIAQRCLTCHSGDEAKGKLDLSSREPAMAGGESGIAIDPEHPEQSLLWEYINSDQMPPKKPLSAAEKARFRTWITHGATWGTEKIDPFRYSTDARAGMDWWSLQPLRNPQPPDQSRTRLEHRIPSMPLSMPSSAKPAWHRPRKPTSVRSFADCHSICWGFRQRRMRSTPSWLTPLNMRTKHWWIVMLASPHYGERWARHWLDIVRFGESNGFEYDQPRDNAWPYRNWVIDALQSGHAV